MGAFFFATGCLVATGVDRVYSPTAAGGSPLPDLGIHNHHTLYRRGTPHSTVVLPGLGGGLTAQVDASRLSSRTNWFGLGVPFVPLFWRKPEPGYEGVDSVLAVQVRFTASGTVTVDSATLSRGAEAWTLAAGSRVGGFAGQEFPPSSDTLSAEAGSEGYFAAAPTYSLSLAFRVAPGDTKECALTLHGVALDGVAVDFPAVRFRKTKRRWTFVGP